MRDSFIFYRSFYEAIKDLPRDIQGEIYTAIMEYSLYGNETENLKPIARSIFTLIKPQIDVNNKRFENGSKGGRPKKSDVETFPHDKQVETKRKPNENQTETKVEPNVNVNDNVNVNNNTPPIIPPLPGDTVATAPDASDKLEGRKEKTWRKDYEIYLNLVREAYRAIRDDPELINRQQTFHPGVDIMLSIEKACENFWATEAGWKHKKKSRAKDIDMKMTLINAIGINRVFKSNETTQKQTKRYDDGDYLQ